MYASSSILFVTAGELGIPMKSTTRDGRQLLLCTLCIPITKRSYVSGGASKDCLCTHTLSSALTVDEMDVAEPPVPKSDVWVIHDFTDPVEKFRNYYAKAKVEMVNFSTMPQNKNVTHIKLKQVSEIFNEIANVDDEFWSRGAFAVCLFT